MAPKDPFMLLSWVNTQLRDYYPSLDELCQAQNLERNPLEASLASADFHYDPETNRFV